MNEVTEHNVKDLIEKFMQEYTDKLKEVELPVANKYVDDVLLPKYTADLPSDVLQAFVEGVRAPINRVLQAHIEASDTAAQAVQDGVTDTVQELTEDVKQVEEPVA